MKITQECINLIKQFEGISLKAYKARPKEKYYTIGIGHYGPDVKAGMTITDEPGIYLPGRCGARTENTLLIVPYKETEFGKFLQFESLTLCPIDKAPILIDMLLPEEIDWLNDYHQRVFDTLSPYLSDDETDWLREACAALLVR